MIEVFIYTGIMFGCMGSGWGFWRAVAWPFEVGELIVAAVERRAK